MQWFYLHFPHLYGETWYREFHSELPLAFIQEKGSHIVNANPAATRAGVEPRMLTNTAFCLSPSMQVEVIYPDKIQQALLRVARLAYRFSAWIGLEPPDGLYLEVATMRQLFGGLPRIRAQILELFQELGYTLRVAAAPTPKAAHLLALSGAEICVDQTNLTKTLSQITISCLDVPDRTRERLQKLGLKTVHDLTQLPSGDLAYRVDADLANYLSQVTGQKSWRPCPIQMPAQFFLRTDLEQDFEDLNPLLFPLSGAVKRYCLFMQHRCLVSQQLTIRLVHRQLPETLMPVRLATADNRTDTWLYMLNRCIERIKLPAPVNGFVLKASEFEEIPPSSLKLFSSHTNMADFQISSIDEEQAKACLLNRLSGRIGASRIKFTGIDKDPRPEHQTIYYSQPEISTSLSERQPVRRSSNASSHRYTAGSSESNPTHSGKHQSMDTNTTQPLWLLARPRKVSIQHYRILSGPLRLNTGWWDNRPAQRDYYLALERHPSSPALHWVFRTINKEWFLHGIFS